MLDSWWAYGYVQGSPSTLLSLITVIYSIQLYADAAATLNVGYVQLPLSGPQMLPFAQPNGQWGFGQIINNFALGPDIQCPGGFAAYWQASVYAVIDNTDTVARNYELGAGVMYRNNEN
jgi:hypothetical protein